MNPGPDARRRTRTVLPALLLCGAVVIAPGCKKKAPPPPPPPPPSAPAAPPPVNVASMLTDPRVQFAESAAPTDESLARAVVAFAGAMASGDAGVVEPMLDPLAKATLANLRASGQWSRATSGLEGVRVVALSSAGDGFALGLAIKPKDEPAYLTGWRVRANDAGGWVFSGSPTSLQTAGQLAELDGVLP